MSFHSIPVVENADFYLDLAFRRAKNSASRERSKIKDTRLEKSRKLEMVKLATIGDIIHTRLFQVVEGFPSFDELTPFYKELVKLTLDYVELKKSLSSVNWVAKTVMKLSRDYAQKIKNAKTIEQMNAARREFYGRVSSIMKKEIGKNLKTLIHARKAIIDYPVIKQMPTICITGFPNVGKSTLLSMVTGSTPDIQSYAFTTKSLNLGYTSIDRKKLQIIDTPGTLARLNGMNNVEKQAFLAMKHASDVIVYVWDLTESYPMEDQERLFNEIKKLKKPVIEYLSKTDLLEKKQIQNFKRKVVTSKKELKEAIKPLLDSQ